MSVALGRYEPYSDACRNNMRLSFHRACWRAPQAVRVRWRAAGRSRSKSFITRRPARRPYDLRHAALSLWLNAGGTRRDRRPGRTQRRGPARHLQPPHPRPRRPPQPADRPRPHTTRETRPWPSVKSQRLTDRGGGRGRSFRHASVDPPARSAHGPQTRTVAGVGEDVGPPAARARVYPCRGGSGHRWVRGQSCKLTGMREHVDGRLSRPTSRTPGQWEGPPCPNHRVHFRISPAFAS